LSRAEEQGRRIFGIKKVIDEFEQQVSTFAHKIGKPLADDSPAVFIGTMVKAVSAAQKTQERHVAFAEQLQTYEADRQQLELDITAAKSRLEQLKKQAAAQSDEALDRAEQDSMRRRKLLEKKQLMLQQLEDNGDGHTLEELRKESSGKGIDGVPAEIDKVAQLVKEMRDRLDQLRQERAELMAQEKEMTGSANAAELKDEANRILAQMRLQVEQYLRVKTAAYMLKEQIEHFRRENQTPLLARAGQLFSQLTLGAFTGLRDDLDNHGNPVILGLRPDDAEVSVDAMSEGSCDQLFFALRLAALEGHLDKTEPLPFVVDDILIAFDDERSLAALQVLARLAAKTQVILFTHHARVIDLARQVKSEAGIFVHDLQ